MSSLLQALQWQRGETSIHKLDPRTKIAWCLLTVAFSVYFLTIEAQIILLITIISYLAAARSIRRFAGGLWSILFLVAFIAALNYLYMGLYYTVATSLRLINILMAFSAFSLTTHPDDLSAALIKLRLPYNFAYMLVASARYAVVMSREFSNIIDAYKARGIEFEGLFLKRVRQYAMILVPLIMCTIRRSFRLAEAMEARAFSLKCKKTYYRELYFKKTDFAFICLVIFYLSIISILYYSLIVIPIWPTIWV
ncbi:MAG: energy-coupling factor transporter transmembrane protein EcfT [Candidatus Methanomethyliales bacterium]|nr:energy-coupling factor transporter transmembrane protein EcfT [Candidatus Methanomethylicales archaeon]